MHREDKTRLQTAAEMQQITLFPSLTLHRAESNGFTMGQGNFRMDNEEAFL